MKQEGLQTASELGDDARQSLKQQLEQIVSVDSEFISRMGVAVHVNRFDTEANRPFIDTFKMPLEIAQLKVIYALYRFIYEGENNHRIQFTTEAMDLKQRFHHLKSFGARPKRLFFASTGVKGPQEDFMRALYGDNWDLAYVQELIAPGTLATHPPATYHGFNDRGRVIKGHGNR